MAVSETRVGKLESWTTTYTERVEGILRDLDRLEKKLDKLEGQIVDDVRQLTVDQVRQLTKIERDLDHAEREIEKLRSSRFDIVKLILAAILGSALTFGFSALSEYFKASRIEHSIRKMGP